MESRHHGGASCEPQLRAATDQLHTSTLRPGRQGDREYGSLIASHAVIQPAADAVHVQSGQLHALPYEDRSSRRHQTILRASGIYTCAGGQRWTDHGTLDASTAIATDATATACVIPSTRCAGAPEKPCYGQDKTPSIAQLQRDLPTLALYQGLSGSQPRPIPAREWTLE
jgi:hypothetical protein